MKLVGLIWKRCTASNLRILLGIKCVQTFCEICSAPLVGAFKPGLLSVSEGLLHCHWLVRKRLSGFFKANLTEHVLDCVDIVAFCWRCRKSRRQTRQQNPSSGSLIFARVFSIERTGRDWRNLGGISGDPCAFTARLANIA